MESKRTYFMFVHKNKAGLWCEFPDLKTCMTDGDNLEELMKNASDCLASYVEGMKLQGNRLPVPSTVEALQKKSEACEDKVIFIAPVTVYLPSVPARINITSTESKIAEITAFARKVSKTRSELMVDATLDYIRAQA